MVKTNETCRDRLETWITWFEELEVSKDYLHLNEKYDLSVGIDVKKRIITKPIKLPELGEHSEPGLKLYAQEMMCAGKTERLLGSIKNGDDNRRDTEERILKN